MPPKAQGAVVAAVLLGTGASSAAVDIAADRRLRQALDELVAMPSGPPGAYALITRDGHVAGIAAGAVRVGAGRAPGPRTRMRIASVSKAITGAAALRLVQQGRLALDQPIGDVLPSLPSAWHGVTLRQLLSHTGGIPDFSGSPGFAKAVNASPQLPPAPEGLLAFVADEPLDFPPGSRFRYSNSGPVIVGLMVQAVTGSAFAQAVGDVVLRPVGMPATVLPAGVAVPRPVLHGYAWNGGRPQDVTSLVAFGGWAWASGGFVSTPSDLSRFVRRDAGGALVQGPTRVAQMSFRAGRSSPPGPGANSVGLGIFRYRTSCGTFYGHTGSILGYTQIIMATRDGRRSAVVSASTQATGGVLRALRVAWAHAACAAVAPGAPRA